MVEVGKLTKRRVQYRCHECDEWRSQTVCPECGTPCAVYVTFADGRQALLAGER